MSARATSGVAKASANPSPSIGLEIVTFVSQADWSKERARRVLNPHAPGPAIPVESVGRSIARKREHGERAAERGVVRERRIASDRAQTIGRLGQAGREADARPAADAGQDRHILATAVLVGHDVADDARRSLELVKLLAGFGVDRLQIAFQRSIEDHAACCRESARPGRELLGVRPYDLAGLAVP